jgi:hypothetical protein
MTDNMNEINHTDDKDIKDVLEHPHIARACEILGIQKEWINTGSFYLWPISDLIDDIGQSTEGNFWSKITRNDIGNNIACGYVFSTFRAIVIKPTDKKDNPIGDDFIYFYGRCVVNPQAPTDDWQFENWSYEMKTIKSSPKKNSLCCWFL